MREKFVMEPYIWYSRPEGNSGEYTQYGLVTDHPDLHFSIYFAPTPWGDKKNDSIGFARFEDDPTSYTARLSDLKPCEMDSYLWFKLSHAPRIARQAIVMIFGGDVTRIK